MHIAMVMRNFSCRGGLELYAHKLVEGLLHEGLGITVLCSDHNSTLKHDNLRVAKFKRSGARLKSQRLIEEFFSLNKVIAQESDKASARQEPFDLIHSQHQPMTGANVVSFHNHTIHRLSQVGLNWERALNSVKGYCVPAYRLRSYFDRLLFASANCCIYTSCATRDDFIRSYQDGHDKLHVVAYPGSDLADSTSSNPEISCDSSVKLSTSDSETGGNVRSHTFLFVGRGYRKKGLDILLSACALLKRRSVKFKLLVAGLPLRATDRYRISAFNIADSVEFLGFQPCMDSIYRQAAAFIMPSRVEPFGMAAIQAMKFGLVPIVSKISGVAEILSDESDALILNNHLSAQQLASLMIRLLNDHDLKARLAKGAIITADKLSWSKTVEQTLLSYKRMLEPPVTRTVHEKPCSTT